MGADNVTEPFYKNESDPEPEDNYTSQYDKAKNRSTAMGGLIWVGLIIFVIVVILLAWLG